MIIDSMVDLVQGKSPSRGIKMVSWTYWGLHKLIFIWNYFCLKGWGWVRVWPSNGRFLFSSLLSTQRSKSPDWGSRRQPFKISLFVRSTVKILSKSQWNTVEIRWKYGGNKYFGQQCQWLGWGLLIKSILAVNHFKPSSSLTAASHSLKSWNSKRKSYLFKTNFKLAEQKYGF